MKKFFFALLILTGNLFSQTNNSVVAKIGDSKISSEEFKLRFEFTPKIKSSISDSAKIKFLAGLIAEELWFKEAVNSGLDTVKFINNSINTIEKMYARDAFFKDVIKSKVKITKEDYRKERDKLYWELYIRFIFSKSKEEIFEIYKQLNNQRFIEILKTRPEFKEQTNPIKIVYGQTDFDKENVLFSLKVGTYSEPYKDKSGWVIFYLENKEKRIFKNAKDKELALKQLDELVESRYTGEVYSEFYKNFHKNRKVSLNKKLYEKLFKNIEKLFPQKQKEKEGFYYFGLSDIQNIKLSFSDYELNDNFILSNPPVKLETYLNDMAFFGLKVPEKELLQSALNSYNKNYIERELYAYEALKKGYNKLPEVKNAVLRWKKNYLAEYYKHSFVEKAKPSDIEIKEFYKNVQKSEFATKYNIQEILVNSLDDVSHLLNDLDKKVPFDELVKKYNQREFTKNTNGVWGFFTERDYPEFGEIVKKMKIGEIYGPIKTENGFSVFKLIDKKETETELGDYESEKPKLKNFVFNKKFENLLQEETVKLAKKYGVEIYKEVLENVQVTDINMVVMKFFGFGGKLQAVPYLQPFSSWLKKAKEENLNF